MQTGGPELMIVLLVVAVLFGPGRISGLARSLGESVHEFRAGLRSSPSSGGSETTGDGDRHDDSADHG